MLTPLEICCTVYGSIYLATRIKQHEEERHKLNYTEISTTRRLMCIHKDSARHSRILCRGGNAAEVVTQGK
jgi:hypothetical protein